MKQKMVMKVSMSCEKCKVKAMKISASAPGVISVELQGERSDGTIVVIGEGMDPVCLVRTLRKKVGTTSIVSLEQVKADEKKGKKEGKNPNNVNTKECSSQYPQGYYYYPPQPWGRLANEMHRIEYPGYSL